MYRGICRGRADWSRGLTTTEVSRRLPIRMKGLRGCQVHAAHCSAVAALSSSLPKNATT